jgi:hypothetical protein
MDNRRFSVKATGLAALGAAGLALMLTTGSRAAGTTDSASAGASAEVIQPISVTKSSDLTFGVVAPTGTAGTVTIDTGGARSSVNVDVLPPPGLGRTFGAATFNVTGQPEFTYSVSLPTSITIASSTDSMLVDMFTDLATNLGTLVNVLGVGKDSFRVGADLNVGAAQAPGFYSGTFTATVTYD